MDEHKKTIIQKRMERTAEALKANGMEAVCVASKKEALEQVV